MRSATISELKQELQGMKSTELSNLCLRLARFKKENKELLTYLLFEAQDEAAYISSIKLEIDELFKAINLNQLYFAKKSLRKILRIINKFSRYSGSKQTDLELRIYFCLQLIESGIPFAQNAVISNMYNAQIKKITATLPAIHEDLQHDYKESIETIISDAPSQKKTWNPFAKKKKKTED